MKKNISFLAETTFKVKPLSHTVDMSIEIDRERTETYWEKRRLNENVEHDLLAKLEAGQESMPDVISCPVASCRCPLTVNFLADRIELACSNCGFRQTVKRG